MNSYVICLLKIYSTCYKVSFLRKTLPKQVKACIFLKEYGNMLKSNQKADIPKVFSALTPHPQATFRLLVHKLLLPSDDGQS